jgi:2-polyprenyl-6-methoxyphenol hydroxylase-like FAD-dependent oxidoreductase
MHDLVIIGAGPGGIALAAEAFASGIDPSQILILEKATKVEDWAAALSLPFDDCRLIPKISLRNAEKTRIKNLFIPLRINNSISDVGDRFAATGLRQCGFLAHARASEAQILKLIDASEPNGSEAIGPPTSSTPRSTAK